MKIKSATFGEQEIDPTTIVEFPQGLLAMEDCKQFKLFHPEGYHDLQWMQSVDKSELTFSLMEPSLLGCEYEFTLDDEETALLGADSEDDVVIYLMVYQGGSEEQEDDIKSSDMVMRANWTSPLVINLEKRIGLQKRLKNVMRTTKVRAS